MYGIKWFVALVVLVFLGFLTYEILPEHPRGQMFNGYDGITGELSRTSDLNVQFWHDGNVYASRRTSVYRSRDMGLTWEKVATIGKRQGGIIRNLRHRIGTLKTVFKLKKKTGISAVTILENGTMIATYGGIFQGVLKEGEVVRLENTYSWKDGSLLPQGLAHDGEGNVFVGEYIVNKPEKPDIVIKLYCSHDQGETWKVCQEFHRSEIRHIHSVSFDPYRNLLWLTTGDADHESTIRYSSDQGISFKHLGGGSQDWRVVSMQFSTEFIYWGTDSPGQWNDVVKWNWDTGDKEVVLTARNPFYYSARDNVNGRFYFSTAVEWVEAEYPSSQYSEIWQISDNKPPRRLLSWPKGELNMWGTIQFAQGDSPPGLLAFTPVNLGEHHRETIVLKTIE